MTFWSLTNSDFPTNQTFHQFHDLDTELDLHRLWVVSMEHLQRVWYASRERLPFRTPGSVPHFGTCLMLQLLRPNSSNWPCLYSTFHLEYPLVLSRFCLEQIIHQRSNPWHTVWKFELQFETEPYQRFRQSWYMKTMYGCLVHSRS